MFTKWLAPLAAAVAMLCIAGPCVFAQSAQANLNGTITDKSGNGIPSASIQVVRKETQWTRSTTAGGSFDQIAGSINSMFDFDHDRDGRGDGDHDRDDEGHHSSLILDPDSGQPAHR